MAIWKCCLSKASDTERENEQLPHEDARDGSALTAEDLLRTPEYLQRLDNNAAETNVPLLPSHYAREDYIHFLHDLKKADGARTMLAGDACPSCSQVA